MNEEGSEGGREEGGREDASARVRGYTAVLYGRVGH